LTKDAKRGTQKKRERANTNTNTPGPERAGPTLKGQEKRQTEADGHGTRPAEGGRGRKRLNQPNKAKTYAYLAQDPTYLGGKKEHMKKGVKN